MGFFLSLFFGVVPMLLFAYLIYQIDRFEKEPVKLLVIVFGWGALVAAGGAFLLNTLFSAGVFMATGSEAASSVATGSIIAPLVEESLKGFAVLLVFLFYHREFDSILDGIIYAAVTALGFAATENTFYIYHYGFQQGGYAGLFDLVFVRVILVGWQHPFYTAFTGIGLASARLRRSRFKGFLFAVLGLSFSMTAHSLHNTLAEVLTGGVGMFATTAIDWIGWFFMLVFILWAIRRDQTYVQRYLAEEVPLGTLTSAQYQTASSPWSQIGARTQALFTRRYGGTRRFYQLCGELAHKKHQLSQMGDEDGNTAIIAGLREEMSLLKETI